MGNKKPTSQDVEKQKAAIEAKKQERIAAREAKKKEIADRKAKKIEDRRFKAEQIAELKRLKAEKKAAEKKAKEPKPEEKQLPNWVDSNRFDTVEVKVELDMKEKNAAGQELAHKKKQLDQIDLERKQHMSSYKDRMDEVKAQMGDLSDKVTLGYEYRKFRCTLHFDFLSKERVYKDADNGKEITRRALQADDYQMRLPV